MRMARQMGNIMIDYDIYLASLQLLIDMTRLINNSEAPLGISNDEWRQENLDLNPVKTFEQIHADYELLRRYGQLYEQRAMIGNQEVQYSVIHVQGVCGC